MWRPLASIPIAHVSIVKMLDWNEGIFFHLVNLILWIKTPACVLLSMGWCRPVKTVLPAVANAKWYDVFSRDLCVVCAKLFSFIDIICMFYLTGIFQLYHKSSTTDNRLKNRKPPACNGCNDFLLFGLHISAIHLIQIWLRMKLLHFQTFFPSYSHSKHVYV